MLEITFPRQTLNYILRIFLRSMPQTPLGWATFWLYNFSSLCAYTFKISRYMPLIILAADFS